jgi:hypothetical protein
MSKSSSWRPFNQQFIENDYSENGPGYVRDSVSSWRLELAVLYVFCCDQILLEYFYCRVNKRAEWALIFLRGRHETFMTFMVMWNWGKNYSGKRIFHTFFFFKTISPLQFIFSSFSEIFEILRNLLSARAARFHWNSFKFTLEVWWYRRWRWDYASVS